MKYPYKQINADGVVNASNAVITANAARTQNAFKAWMTTAAHLINQQQHAAELAEKNRELQMRRDERIAEAEATAQYRADVLAFEKQKHAAAVKAAAQAANEQSYLRKYAQEREAAAAKAAAQATAAQQPAAAPQNRNEINAGAVATPAPNSNLFIQTGEGLNKPAAPISNSTNTTAPSTAAAPTIFSPNATAPAANLSATSRAALDTAALLPTPAAPNATAPALTPAAPAAQPKPKQTRPEGKGIYSY